MFTEGVKQQGFRKTLIIQSFLLLSLSSANVAAEQADVLGIATEHSIEDGVVSEDKNVGQALAQSMRVSTSFDNPDKRHGFNSKIRIDETDDGAEHVYIVELHDKPLAQNSRFLRSRDKQLRNKLGQNAINKMRQEIRDGQEQVLQAASRSIGLKKPLLRYEFALNGFAIRMTQEEAKVMAQMEQVAKITRDQVRQLDTDRGPTLIGAPNLWNGEIANLPSTQGEGIVVGIIDSGINSDHPSFAAQSGDGFTHINPLGEGVYIGDCENQTTALCNSKLIGIRSYASITDAYADLDVFPPNLPRIGEDYDGHGSHVAAIAAGNVLLNQTEIRPEADTQESDGIAGPFTFTQVSGVAPRANIIAYQACFPGEASDNDTYAGCLTSVINEAIDNAIMDGVDVINFSISGGGDPWRDSTERAFLNALSAGIFVAVSAGNSGPDASTSEKSAPWYTAVAASEHGRENGFAKELNNFAGGDTPPPVLAGRSNTAGLRAPIVYAGDFTNSNDPNNDAAQCLQPFPANTFNGQIVVCDRGEIARLDKAQNVAAGGAGGFVLANIDGGATFLADDAYVIPGIHIKVEQGNALKSWLDSGSGHTATITQGQALQIIDQDRVDIVADFSSRGPNLNISTLTPTMTAPGVNIYSAFADQSFGKDGDSPPSAGDFSYLQGTSMSSPHVAGAAALLMAAKPDWTADQVRSALSMTATPDMTLEDEITDADYFDMGAGRIRVDIAAQTGLLMNVTTDQYLAADPRAGGDPRALNLPSITDNNCQSTCTWSRTFVATQDGSWQINAEAFSDDLTINVSPSSFDILQGQSQTIEVAITSASTAINDYAFGRLLLTAANSPDLRLPISIRGSIGDVPSSVELNVQRNIDETFINDLQTISLSGLIGTVFNVVDPTFVELMLAQDSAPREILDDLTDGINITQVAVAEGSKRMIAKITDSSAQDVDLYIFRDANDDGFISSSEELGRSITSGVTEEVQIEFPLAGTYFILVQSFSGSDAQQDSISMHYALVSDEAATDVTADLPTDVEQGTTFDIGLRHDFDTLNSSIKYGALGLSTQADDLDALGLINLDFMLAEFDTEITGTPSRVMVDDTASLQVLVRANSTEQERQYEIKVPTPNGTVFTNFSEENNGRIENNVLIWDVVKSANDSTDTTLDFEVQIVDDSSAGPFDISLSSELVGRSFTSVFNPPSFTGVQVEGAPEIAVNNGGGLTFVVRETQQLIIPFTTTDPNDDAVTVSVEQTSGTAATTQQNSANIVINAPSVSQNETLTFDVTATDTFSNQTTSSITVNVTNNAAPVIDSVSAPTSGAPGQSITITFAASDADGDDLNFSINQSTGASGSFTLPSTGTSASFTLSVDDGIDTTTQVVTVTINTPPAASGSGGGAMQWYFGLFCLTFVAIRFRRIRRYRGNSVYSLLNISHPRGHHNGRA